jgi:hypothetical protein
MMLRTSSIVLFVGLYIFTYTTTFSQSPTVHRWSNDYLTIERLSILRQADSIATPLSLTNVDTKTAYSWVKNAWKNPNLSTTERFRLTHFIKNNQEFIVNEVSENQEPTDGLFKSGYNEIDIDAFPSSQDFERKPILKHFYNDATNFFKVETPNFKTYINPVIGLSFFNQKDNAKKIFQNTRGLEARAYIDDKVYVYLHLTENQRSFLNYIDQQIATYGAVPGQGKAKGYISTVIDNLQGYDYFTTKAYVGFKPTQSINVELGHGNHFIGNGYRSLLLSDYAANRFYLSLDWRFWKFEYKNIYSELQSTTFSLTGGDNVLPKKFNVTHYLNFVPNDKFEIGVFETVVFARENQFELNYLNPVILYRAVEFNLGSPDNVLLGANFQWKFAKGFALYGQAIMDEFYLKEVRASNGWWANKFGGQVGLKYYNAFNIKNLDINLEMNAVRPFTYAHRDTIPVGRPYSVSSYSHAHLPLAHPLGANFREYIALATYMPSQKITLQGKILATTYGADPAGQNWGGDILLDNNRRFQEYNNTIGQGIRTNVRELSVRASYEVFNNYFIDFHGAYRTSVTPSATANQHYIGGGIRINLASVPIDY